MSCQSVRTSGQRGARSGRCPGGAGTNRSSRVALRAGSATRATSAPAPHAIASAGGRSLPCSASTTTQANTSAAELLRDLDDRVDVRQVAELAHEELLGLGLEHRE